MLHGQTNSCAQSGCFPPDFLSLFPQACIYPPSPPLFPNLGLFFTFGTSRGFQGLTGCSKKTGCLGTTLINYCGFQFCRSTCFCGLWILFGIMTDRVYMYGVHHDRVYMYGINKADFHLALMMHRRERVNVFFSFQIDFYSFVGFIAVPASVFWLCTCRQRCWS